MWLVHLTGPFMVNAIQLQSGVRHGHNNQHGYCWPGGTQLGALGGPGVLSCCSGRGLRAEAIWRMDERKQSLVAALDAKVLEIGYIQSSRPVRNTWWERRPQSVEWQGLKPTQGFFWGQIRCVLQVSILRWMVARDQCQLKLLPTMT